MQFSPNITFSSGSVIFGSLARGVRLSSGNRSGHVCLSRLLAQREGASALSLDVGFSPFWWGVMPLVYGGKAQEHDNTVSVARFVFSSGHSSPYYMIVQVKTSTHFLTYTILLCELVWNSSGNRTWELDRSSWWVEREIPWLLTLLVPSNVVLSFSKTEQWIIFYIVRLKKKNHNGGINKNYF